MCSFVPRVTSLSARHVLRLALHVLLGVFFYKGCLYSFEDCFNLVMKSHLLLRRCHVQPWRRISESLF